MVCYNVIFNFKSLVYRQTDNDVILFTSKMTSTTITEKQLRWKQTKLNYWNLYWYSFTGKMWCPLGSTTPWSDAMSEKSQLIWVYTVCNVQVQSDHNWILKNQEVLANMHATEETLMIFSNSLDPNESIFKTRKIRRYPEKSGEMVSQQVPLFAWCWPYALYAASYHERLSLYKIYRSLLYS